MTNNNTCNGWANYETWNVALWLNNNEGLYFGMLDAIRNGARTYEDVRDAMGLTGETKDNVAWDDLALDTAELDAMIAETAEGLR